VRQAERQPAGSRGGNGTIESVVPPHSDHDDQRGVMGALRSTEELQEALHLVVASYRDIGPPPADDEAVYAWAQQYGYIADLAGQLTGARARYALAQLRKLAAARRGNPRP
jgi:hypothetical protein